MSVFEFQMGRAKSKENTHAIRAKYDDPQSSSEAAGGETRWFEASIQSVRADELLAQNGNLELGEESGWTPETFSNAMVLDDLYLSACEMLKRMDTVGVHNDNGAIRPVPIARSSPEKPVVTFW